MTTQTTPNGSLIENVTWNSVFKRQEAWATLKTGERIRVWRGGWEEPGKGWQRL